MFPAERPWRTPLIGVVLVVGVAITPVASAKEPAAGCKLLTAVVERTRNALALSAVHRQRGSAIAAYQVLAVTARGIEADARRAECGALDRVLSRALADARKAPDAHAARSILEIGYAAALSLAAAGRLPTGEEILKLSQGAESVSHGSGCPDFWTHHRRLDDDTVAPATRARAVLDDLARSPRCESLRTTLASTSGAALDTAILRIVLDEPEPLMGKPTVFDLCPELPLIHERLASAIAVGAPRYNRGDKAGCRDHYADTARQLVEQRIPSAHCPTARSALDEALRLSATESDPDRGAWALRHAFDEILELRGDHDAPSPSSPATLDPVQSRALSFGFAWRKARGR